MVDPLGIGLLVAGLALVVIELAYPGYYVGVAGSVGIATGLGQMMSPDFLTSPASPWAAGTVAAVAAAASFFFYRRFAPPVRLPVAIPTPELIGQPGVVRTRLRPYTLHGQVEVGGSVYNADADEPLGHGLQVIVTNVIGGHVVVRRRARADEPDSTTPKTDDRRHE